MTNHDKKIIINTLEKFGYMVIALCVITIIVTLNK